ncbi:outer envelope pore protein [Medicago truncatula]|uniref:Outer envelope pore protein n=1 Tax=Medicago truncatula TaxID=3880 RepID=G7IF51_MEDTR|nr:outer envelope pore protein [Medicago truncatula]
MEEDQNDAVPCSSLAVESMLRVGTAGAIWGLCTGPYDATIQGLRGIPRASFVANSVRIYGTQCGLVAGVFSITRCGVKKYRGRNDWVSLFVCLFVTSVLFIFTFQFSISL